jgi:SSS family solute:Na+ symporter
MSLTPQTGEVLITVLVLVGIGVVAVQLLRGKRGGGAEEYYLANRSVSWVVLALSLSMTTVWGVWCLFVGIPLSVGLMAWTVPGGVAVVGLLFLGVILSLPYRSSHASTLPAFLRARYGKSVGLTVAGVSIAVTLFVSIPFTILIGSRLLSVLLGWELVSSALLMVVVTGLFVIAGGYPAVMATHVAGSVAAGAGILCLAMNGFSPGEEGLHRILPGTEASFLPAASALMIVGLWFTCIDQSIVQRVMAARSCKAIKGGAAAAAGLVLLGVVALSFGFGPIPGEGSRMVENTIGAGFIGAAIVAFSVASLAGLFMSAATVFAMDVFRAGEKKSDEATLILVGRLANTVIVILAIMAASLIALAGSGSIIWMARALGIVLPPIVVILLLGLSWPRMHGRGALWALLLGWSTGIGFVAMSAEGLEGMTRGVLLTFAISAVVCIGVSLVTAPRAGVGASEGAIVHEDLQVPKP